MTKLLAGLTYPEVQDIARAFLSALRYMADHNGLEGELDDWTNVLDDSVDVLDS